jgi:drug/metabolite transporter (DMT)-like permease
MSAVFGYSIIPILAKLGLGTGLPASVLLFYRFLIATLFFGIYCLVKRADLTPCGRRTFRALPAGLLYCAQCFCFFTAFNNLPASLGAILYNCYPVFVLILSKLFLNESVTPPKLIGVFTAILGTVIIIYAPWGSPERIGIALIILTALISSCHLVYNKKFTMGIDRVVLTFYVCAVCVVCFFAYGALTGELTFVTDYRIWVNIGLLALWSTIIGLFGFMKAVSLLNAGLISVINLAEPVLTVIFSAIILSETLTARQAVGAAVVIFGICVYEYRPRRGA